MKQIVVRCGDRLWRFALPLRPATLGSSPDCDLWVPAPGVSAVHALIEPAGSGVEVSDQGSKNGLVVGRERRERVALVAGGECVWLGRAWLELADASSDELELVVGGRRADTRSSAHSTEIAEPEPTRGEAVLAVLAGIAGGAPNGVAAGVEELRAALGLSGLVLLDRRGAEPCVLGASGDVAALLAATSETLAATTLPVGGPRVERVDGGNSVCALAQQDSRQASPEWHRQALSLACALLDRRGGASASDGASAGPPGRPDDVGDALGGLVLGPAPGSRALRLQIGRLAVADVDVLVCGETGTGKEMVARALHRASTRRNGPYVAINCAAIPDELFEAELFGIERGVATGVQARAGLALAADGGVLFLDEVGELSPLAQAKLLRFLQEREVRPIGRREPRRVQLRTIAATNRELPQLVRAGAFRADLYYRLAACPLVIPPLRERIEDLPLLVETLLERAQARLGSRVRGVAASAMTRLLVYDWPGNVRELEQVLVRAVIQAGPGGTIGRGELRLEAIGEVVRDADRWLLAEVEREHIRRALVLEGGNRSRAARRLGISREGLRKKLGREEA